jgi:hypothetical protein
MHSKLHRSRAVRAIASVALSWLSISGRSSAGEPCSDLKLTLQIAESHLTLHAPVIAGLVIDYRGTEATTIDLGKNSKGNLRFSFTLPDGSQIDAAPVLPPVDGIYVPGKLTLRPGETVHQRLLLNEWQAFDAPGVYRVTLRVEQSESSCETRSLSASAEIAITSRNPDRLREVCDKLARAAIGPDALTSVAAAEALSYTRDEACLPALAKVLKESVHGRSWALTGMARLGSRDAATAVAADWTSLDSFEQAQAMNEFMARGKGGELRAALDKLRRGAPGP